MKNAPPETAPAPPFFSADVSAARRFYLDMKPNLAKGVTVVCGGREDCSPQYEMQREGFPYLSLEFIVRGKGALTLSGKQFDLTPGTLFSYGPGVPHQIRTDPLDCLTKYFIDFGGAGASRFLKEASLSPGTCTQVSTPGEIQELFDILIRNGLLKTPETARICALLLEVLSLKVKEKAIAPGSANSRAFATYERCCQLIEDHFLELRTLDDVADRCNVDKAYMCRLFSRFAPQTPYQKLLHLQMDHAAERLQNSGKLVRQVADELGWDPFHFSRVFKKVCGLSPERFLKVTGRAVESRP